MNQLVKNYNLRINRFVLDMIKNPLKVKEYIGPIETSRKQLMEEASAKLNGQKNFIFKNYVTERERLAKHLEEKRIHDEYLKSCVEKKKKKSTSFFYQPKMRFKPRTDLERIVDSINEYNYNKVNSDLVKKQLKSLDLHYMKKKILKKEKNTLSSSTSDFSSSYDDIKVKQEVTSEKSTMKSSSNNFFAVTKRNFIDNSVAKQLMQEYHYKTHFKAATTLAEKYTDKNTKIEKEKVFRQTQNLFKRRLHPHNTKFHNRSMVCQRKNNSNETSEKKVNLQLNKSILTKFQEKFPLGKENFDLIKANPLLYNLNFRTLKSNLDTTTGPKTERESDKLEYLLKLSQGHLGEGQRNSAKAKVKFNNSIETRRFRRSTTTNNKNKKDTEEPVNFDSAKEERIWVNNEAIPISQIDLIASKMLKNCNYIHKKNPNSNTSLKKGDGKLMITSGMTLNEFVSKYNVA